MKHLSDEQIQEYLDKKHISEYREIHQHLKVCELCRINLKNYETIFNSLKHDEELWELSPDFLTNTYAKIDTSQNRKRNIIENIIIAFTFSVSLIFIIYLFDLSFFLNYFRNIDLSLFDTMISKISSSILPSWLYMFIAAIIIVLIEIMDRFKIQKSIKYLNHLSNHTSIPF